MLFIFSLPQIIAWVACARSSISEASGRHRLYKNKMAAIASTKRFLPNSRYLLHKCTVYLSLTSIRGFHLTFPGISVCVFFLTLMSLSNSLTYETCTPCMCAYLFYENMYETETSF